MFPNLWPPPILRPFRRDKKINFLTPSLKYKKRQKYVFRPIAYINIFNLFFMSWFFYDEKIKPKSSHSKLISLNNLGRNIWCKWYIFIKRIPNNCERFNDPTICYNMLWNCRKINVVFPTFYPNLPYLPSWVMKLIKKSKSTQLAKY